MAKKKANKRPIEFSKKILYFDYLIAVILLAMFFICEGINGIYTIVITNQLIQSGADMSLITIANPFNLDMFGTLLGIWIGQLAVSSGAYYFMVKSDHQIELPVYLLQSLPDDVKKDVDMTTLITSALNITNN